MAVGAAVALHADRPDVGQQHDRKLPDLGVETRRGGLLADVRSVGVQGDGRTYGHPIVLRPVSSEDAMTAD